MRALLSILAPASLLEKRGGNVGRGRGLLLKNKGDGGWTSAAYSEAKKELLSSVCLARGRSFWRLLDGSDVGPGSWKGFTSLSFLLWRSPDVGGVRGGGGGGGGGGNSENGEVERAALPRLTLRPLYPWVGVAIDVRSVNEFHIDSAGSVSLFRGDDVGQHVAFVVCINVPVSVASGATDEAACTVLGWRQSGVLCRRKGDEVRGVRCEERAGRRVPQDRVSLCVKMEGEVFIPGAIPLADRDRAVAGRLLVVAGAGCHS